MARSTDSGAFFFPTVTQYHPEIFCTYDTKSSRESEVLRLASGHDGNQPWADRLEGENVTALSTTASKDTTAALRAAANKKTVRASALGLGGLVGTLSSHDYSLMSGESLQTGEKPYFCGKFFLTVSDWMFH